MFKRLQILTAVAVLWSAPGVAAETELTALTLENVVVIALAENRDLTAARFAIAQAEARLVQAGLWPNPELELSHEGDRFFARDDEYSVTAGFRQRFPITGRIAKARSVARVDVAQAIAEVRNQERLLAGEVLVLARELLVTQQKLDVNQALQNRLQKLIDVSEKRLSAAEVSAADVILAKLELQKLVLAQAGLRNEQEVATTALNPLLGRAPQSPMEMSGVVGAELDLDAVADVSRQALARRPDRQLAALGIDRADTEVKLAHAEKWEDWTVGFEYNRERSTFNEPTRLEDTDNLFALSVSVPLPLWNKNQGRIREAQATQERAEAELHALELRISAEVQTAENQMRRLLGILRQYGEQSIPLAEQNIALLQQGYSDGLISVTAVIQAQQQLTELRQSYVETLGDFIRARTAWETATAAVLAAK